MSATENKATRKLTTNVTDQERLFQTADSDDAMSLGDRLWVTQARQALERVGSAVVRSFIYRGSRWVPAVCRSGEVPGDLLQCTHVCVERGPSRPGEGQPGNSACVATAC